VLVAAALCLVNPYWATDIIGFGLGVAMTVLQLMRRADKPVKSTAS